MLNGRGHCEGVEMVNLKKVLHEVIGTHNEQ